jgi:hypothetical protein
MRNLELEQYPCHLFQLNSIKRTTPNCLIDADFERLRRLQKLASVYVIDAQSQVTDDGFRRLADVISIAWFT